MAFALGVLRNSRTRATFTRCVATLFAVSAWKECMRSVKIEMEYKRLTNQEWSENIDLTQELGYSYIYKRLHELEDKIEQGTLIELPCKVGDTVYVIIKAENGYALLKDICDGFMIKDGEVYIGLQTYNVGANKYYFTREEAEKRLKELQDGRSD